MFMDFWSVLAGVAVVFTCIQMLPQVFKSLRTRCVRDLSLLMAVNVSMASGLWLLYAIHIGDGWILLANAINFPCAMTLLIMKIFGRRVGVRGGEDLSAQEQATVEVCDEA
jgi:uncharacterized protein with PQ loop repeat